MLAKGQVRTTRQAMHSPSDPPYSLSLRVAADWSRPPALILDPARTEWIIFDSMAFCGLVSASLGIEMQRHSTATATVSRGEYVAGAHSEPDVFVGLRW